MVTPNFLFGYQEHLLSSAFSAVLNRAKNTLALVSTTNRTVRVITIVGTVLNRYFLVARILPCLQYYISDPLGMIRVLRVTCCLPRPLSLGRAREILKKKIEVIGVDPCGFSNHSFRFGGATAAANLNVPDHLFKVHGRWKSDSAKDGYVVIKSTRGSLCR